MKTQLHKEEYHSHSIKNQEPLRGPESQEELQSLRLERQRVLSRIKAIEGSHWYSINALPEQRERNLQEAQETFHKINKKISQLSRCHYPFKPKGKKIRFFKEGGSLYRLSMSETHPGQYLLAVLSSELFYEEKSPMNLEEFGRSHPAALELQDQQVREEMERLLHGLKTLMGYYSL